MNSALGFMDRAKASFFLEPERVKFIGKRLEASGKYPNGFQLKQDRDKNLYVQTPDGNREFIDPPGMDFGDIADVVGDVPETLLGTLGAIKGAGVGTVLGGPGLGTAAGGVTGGALGSAGGESIRRVVSEFLDPELSDPSQGRQGSAAAMGAAGELVGGPLVKLAGKGVQKGLLAPIGAALEKRAVGVKDGVETAAKELGIDSSLLPASAKTKSSFVRGAEQLVRESPVTADKLATNIDEPLQKEMEGAFGRIRGKMGGGVTDAMDSGIDPDLVNRGLIETVQESRELSDKAITSAWNDFQSVVDPNTVQAQAPNLSKLADEWSEAIQQNPKAMEGLEFQRLSSLVSEAKLGSLNDLNRLRKAIGSLMDTSLERPARRAYAAIMQDIEATVMSMPQGAQGVEKLRQYLDLSSLQFIIDGSPTVKRLFPNGAPNVFALEDATKTVFRGGVESIRAFKQRLGVASDSAGLREFTDSLKGRGARATTQLPETSQGAFVWDQMKQLHLDDTLRRLSADPREFHVSGKRLFTEFFGSSAAERKTSEIYGPEVAEELKKFSLLLGDTHVSERFFSNFSRTDVRLEMRGFLGDQPITSALIQAGKRRATASQFMKNQGVAGEGAFLGREFLLEGKVPDVSAYIHALGQKALKDIPGTGFLSKLSGTGNIPVSSALRGGQQTMVRQFEGER